MIRPMKSMDSGSLRSGIGNRKYSIVCASASVSPQAVARAGSSDWYCRSSPFSVKSMNVRTPAASRASSFGRVVDGAQGYSHATSIGVAQYEFGIGLRHIVLVIGLGSGFWKAEIVERSEPDELEGVS